MYVCSSGKPKTEGHFLQLLTFRSTPDLAEIKVISFSTQSNHSLCEWFFENEVAPFSE